ncbi:hypothetical protein J5226_04265 [Lysobacter sp. K5869]|nr:hypothetical protein [Lysobacter sp. K5869]QWP77632.1 hypothetical protein J5226_04265 [Lysobacter sp. K5869]
MHHGLDAWRLQLNAGNFSDKEYVPVCSSAAWRYCGYLRAATASLRYRW